MLCKSRQVCVPLLHGNRHVHPLPWWLKNDEEVLTRCEPMEIQSRPYRGSPLLDGRGALCFQDGFACFLFQTNLILAALPKPWDATFRRFRRQSKTLAPSGLASER